MPITKTVDKTSVHGSEQFLYTINFSYSGLTKADQVGEIIDVYPANIKFGSPIVGPGEVVKAISQILLPNGSRQVTYHLGTVNNGTSGSFNYFCNFGPGRRDGDTFANTATLHADGVQLDSSTADTVTLKLEENFVLGKSFQYQSQYRAGDELEVYLYLANAGDNAGAKISNISITDVLPAGLTAITSVLPTGNDMSLDGYNDKTYDGRTGTWTGNTLNFTIPGDYYGARYAITFKVKIDNNVTPGQMITNTAKWTANAIRRNDASAYLTIFIDTAGGLLSKYAPSHAALGGNIYYRIGSNNTGTVNMTNFEWNDVLPDEVDITKMSFNSTTTQIDKYSIYIITTNAPSTEIPVVTDVEGSTLNLDLTPYIPIGKRITKIIIRANVVYAQSGSFSAQLLGVINSTAVFGETITNNCGYTAQTTLGNISYTNAASTILDGKSYLNIEKSAGPNSSLRPLDEVNIWLRSVADKADIINPIFIDYLPVGLEFLANSYYFQYNDYVNGQNYDSRNPGWPSYVPQPVPQVIKNFNGSGRTLVRWDFSAFTIPAINILSVRFIAVVSVSPPTSFINTAYQGNPGDHTFMNPYSEFLDSLDFDGDGITNEKIVKSQNINFTALSSSVFRVEKFVQGEKDTTFSQLGTTVAGGTAEYNLHVTNSFANNIKDIQLVDILPYVGDTGVILNNTPRGSQYEVLANSIVTAKIINILGDPVDPNPDIIIEYNKSNDPVRFDENDQPIGTDPNWSTTPPSNIAQIRSFRVTTGPNVVLRPYDRLVVEIQVKASDTASSGQTAYNSFATKATQITPSGNDPLLPTEPNKVGLTIQYTPVSNIGDFVWIDTNGNGIYDPSEVGINGVTVELYNEGGTLLNTTVTANSPNTALPGYYLFQDLNPGNYYVKFIPHSGYFLTVQQNQVPNGSKPNPNTGLTDVFSLAAGVNDLTMNAGVIRCSNPPVINAKNLCLEVGAIFDPLVGVSSTDCDGSNIPVTVANVIFNNVDTSKAGMYTVTYKVTSPINGFTSQKTIYVGVTDISPRQQAISDLYESVALEQTALSHIMNAEGEKIQKAVTFHVSLTELIKINESVKNTTNAIIALEMILQNKLELFKDSAYSPGCDFPE